MDHVSAFLYTAKQLLNKNGINYTPSKLFNIFTILREAHDEVNLEEVQVIIEEFIEKATSNKDLYQMNEASSLECIDIRLHSFSPSGIPGDFVEIVCF